MGDRVGWFADVEDVERDPDGNQASPSLPGYEWQPVLQTAGLCLSMDIWFPSKGECEKWISDNVLGKGLIDG